MERFVGKIGVDLSASSIQRHPGLIRKVLGYALNRNLLQAIPQFPKIRKQDAPRGSFSPTEYEQLLTRAKAMVGTEHVIRANAKPGHKQSNVVRPLKITADLPHMIDFIANSFIRPTDLKHAA